MTDQPTNDEPNHEQDDEQDSFPNDLQGDSEQPTDDLRPDPVACPACESTAIRRMPRLALAIVGVIFVLTFDFASWGRITEISGIGIGIVILLVIMLGRWRCRDCGHGWK